MFVRYFTQIPPMTPATRGKPTLRRKWRKPLWGQPKVSKCSTMRYRLKENLREHYWNPNNTNISKFLTGTLQTRTIRSRSWGSLLQLHWLERRTSSLLMVCTRWLEFEVQHSINVFLLQPHQPWDCPAEFYDLYPEDVVGLPANPYVPEVKNIESWVKDPQIDAQDFPDVAWARPTGVLNFPDCSPEGQGIPDLGLPNVSPSFCALIQYNTLLSCPRSPSTTPRLLRSVEPTTPVLALRTSR